MGKLFLQDVEISQGMIDGLVLCCQQAPAVACRHVRNKSPFSLNIPVATAYAVGEIESGWNPQAKREESHLGDSSYGVMQILSKTAFSMGFSGDPELLASVKNPRIGVFWGVVYLGYCFLRFPEIGSDEERWKFALAAYNCGVGNVNAALSRARSFEGKKSIHLPGRWQTWDYAKCFLPELTREKSSITMRYILKAERIVEGFGMTLTGASWIVY